MGLPIGPAENGAPTHLAGLPYGLTFVKALTSLGRARQSRDLGRVGG
jgi:hypothetical protein